MSQHQRFAPQQKLTLHTQFADYMNGKPIYPVNVEISPSGVCQASCDFCFYAGGELGSHRKVFLREENLLEILGQCMDMGVKSISWTGGGEPSLHPAIASVVAWCGNEFGLQQGMFTNALSMPRYAPDNMEWIRVTMTDKPYKIDCIKPLRAAKTLGFAFNYSGPQDDDYLRQTLEVADQVQADYVQVRPALKFHGQTVAISPPDITHPLLHITDYKFEEARHKHGYKTCEGYHFSPFIWEDGNVDVCSYMRKHEGYTLGNIYQDSLKTILDRAPQHVPVHDQCQVCCRLHETNSLIHRSRKLEDKNFP